MGRDLPHSMIQEVSEEVGKELYKKEKKEAEDLYENQHKAINDIADNQIRLWSKVDMEHC